MNNQLDTQDLPGDVTGAVDDARPASGRERDCGASRREFLFGATALAGVGFAGRTGAIGPAGDAGNIIDVNVTLGRWPLRRVPGDEPRELVERLRSCGIGQAWVGSFDALLHKDVGGVNRRLAADCRRHGRGLLQPFGVVNPVLPDWEEELRRCALEWRMKGIRLHPNYHGYDLADPALARLLRRAAGYRLIVQIPLILEDERMMHPRLQVAPVDTGPLAALMREIPGLRVVLLNSQRTLRTPAVVELVRAGAVHVDIALLEGVGGLGNLIEAVPPERVLFGSHAPLFHVESAWLKLRESVLTAAQSRAVRSANAARLLGHEAAPG